MGSEKYAWALFLLQALKYLAAFHFDETGLGGVGVIVKNLVQEDVFCQKTRHVAPHAEGDFLAFFLGFFWKGSTDVGHGHAMAAKERADATRGSVQQICGGDWWQKAKKTKNEERQLRDQPHFNMAEFAPETIECEFQMLSLLLLCAELS